MKPNIIRLQKQKTQIVGLKVGFIFYSG